MNGLYAEEMLWIKWLFQLRAFWHKHIYFNTVAMDVYVSGPVLDLCIWSGRMNCLRAVTDFSIGATKSPSPNVRMRGSALLYTCAHRPVKFVFYKAWVVRVNWRVQLSNAVLCVHKGYKIRPRTTSRFKMCGTGRPQRWRSHLPPCSSAGGRVFYGSECHSPPGRHRCRGHRPFSLADLPPSLLAGSAPALLICA